MKSLKTYTNLFEATPYNYEDLRNHHAIACIIFDSDYNMLMLYNNKHDMWTIPAGKNKPGESLQDTVRIEMKEELDIDIITAYKVNTTDRIYEREGKGIKVIENLFYVKEYSGEIKNMEPEKHKYLKFMSFDEISKLKEISNFTITALKYLASEHVINKSALYEYVVHKGYSLDEWNKLKKSKEGRKKISELKKEDGSKAVWKVVHGHTDSRGNRGDNIYKTKPYTTLEKANARHATILLN